MMNYNEALEYIHSIPKFVRPLGNAHLSELLSKMGNPERGLKYIHIAGTNGKGSTAAFTTQILMGAGYKVGLYSSPFIYRFNERIQINRTPIDDGKLAGLTEYVKSIADENSIQVSEFAFITAIMFKYFADEKCDYVVLEVGLGGRLDATNIIEQNEVCAIASISLDHTALLGDTIREIAAEKCGIIKQGSDVVLYPDLHPDALDVAKETCKRMNSTYHIASIDDVKVTPSLPGEYQKYNASVSVGIVKVLIQKDATITEQNITDGLKNAYWPARLERIADRLILDGAHNPDAIRQLCDYFKAQHKKVNMVVAMMKDKAVTECVASLAEIAKSVTVCELDMPRCASKDDLIKEFAVNKINAIGFESAKKAVQHAMTSDGDVLVCGSLYLCGEVSNLYQSH